MIIQKQNRVSKCQTTMSQEILKNILQGNTAKLQNLREHELYSLCCTPPLKLNGLVAQASSIYLLHLLSIKGLINLVPKNILESKKASRILDASGRNLYHHAAASGHLNQLPNLTLRRLCKTSNHNYTPLDYAAANRHLDQVPKSILKRALMVTNSIGGTYVTYAAKYGNLDQLPSELLVPQYFSSIAKALNQTTIYKNLDSVPQALLVEEVLSNQDWSGNTILHNVVRANGKIPEINLELLLIKNVRGETVLETLITTGHIEKIILRPWPKSFFQVAGKAIWEAHEALINHKSEVREAPNIDLF